MELVAQYPQPDSLLNPTYWMPCQKDPPKQDFYVRGTDAQPLPSFEEIHP
jgi:hypothetical protein